MPAIMDQFSDLLKPHVDRLEMRADAWMYMIYQELVKIRESSRPNIYDRLSFRPFSGTTAPVSVAETKSNEILKLQTVWIQFRHELTAEPLPAFIIQVNGIPIYSLGPGRILEPKEWGFAAETFGGDLVVPRGSLLEVTPALTGKFECRGTFTFIRDMIEAPARNAGFGQSGEQFDLLSHAGEHEIWRDFVGEAQPHAGYAQQDGRDPYVEQEGPAVGGRLGGVRQ